VVNHLIGFEKFANDWSGSSAEILPQIRRLAASEGKAAAPLSSNPPSQYGQLQSFNRLLVT